MLTEAAEYAFSCQDVYPDKVAFAAAIPDHLKPIFLIPVRISTSLPPKDSRKNSRIASRIAFMDGSTPEGDLFSYQTFLYNDITPNTVSTEPGSIFRRDDAQSQTHHQEYNFDQNIQIPTDTSFNSDVDISQYFTYPYRTVEKPVRKSSTNQPPILITRLAITAPEIIKLQNSNAQRQNGLAQKVVRRAANLTPSLIDYNSGSNQFKFQVSGGSKRRTVYVSLIDFVNKFEEYKRQGRKPDKLVDEVDVVVNCDCPFWRWNGPEHHAVQRGYTFLDLKGTAAIPNIKDYYGVYNLCKHTYSVLSVLRNFFDDILNKYGLNLEVVQAVLESNLDVLTPEEPTIIEEDIIEPIEDEDISLDSLPTELSEPIQEAVAPPSPIKLPKVLSELGDLGKAIFNNIRSKPQNRVYLTKQEVYNDFKKKINPLLPIPERAKRLKLQKEWTKYLKALASAGAISTEQLKSWKNPFIKEVSLSNMLAGNIPSSRTTSTKKEVFETFKKRIAPLIKGIKNKSELLKQEWVSYLDKLKQLGVINSRQRNNWRNPYDDKE
jgi:hypothetical protein